MSRTSPAAPTCLGSTSARVDGDPAIEVVYAQPHTQDDITCIDFAQFAAHVARFSDPLSQRFARSLREWTAAAGAPAHQALDEETSGPHRRAAE
jgi:hypothetical protein